MALDVAQVGQGMPTLPLLMQEPRCFFTNSWETVGRKASTDPACPQTPTRSTGVQNMPCRYAPTETRTALNLLSQPQAPNPPKSTTFGIGQALETRYELGNFIEVGRADNGDVSLALFPSCRESVANQDDAGRHVVAQAIDGRPIAKPNRLVNIMLENGDRLTFLVLADDLSASAARHIKQIRLVKRVTLRKSFSRQWLIA